MNRREFITGGAVALAAAPVAGLQGRVKKNPEIEKIAKLDCQTTYTLNVKLIPD